MKFLNTIVLNILLIQSVFVNCQLTLTSGKTFNLSIKDSTTLIASFTFTSTGWAGIGIGGSTMTNCDMWILEILSDKSYNLYDSYSQGRFSPPTDTSLNGSNDLKNVQFSYSNGIYTIIFERLLKTNDPFDYEIKLQSSRINIIWAWGSGTLSDHGRNYKSGYFSIDSNNLSSPINTAGSTSSSSTSTPSTTNTNSNTSTSANTNTSTISNNGSNSSSSSTSSTSSTPSTSTLSTSSSGNLGTPSSNQSSSSSSDTSIITPSTNVDNSTTGSISPSQTTITNSDNASSYKSNQSCKVSLSLFIYLIFIILL